MHPYLADVGDNLYALAPSPLNFETHWARFTQAVVAQQWLDSMEERGSDPLFSLEQGDLDQDAVERFTGIVREAVLFLSRNYPVLGLSRDDNSYRTATTTPAAAESCWRDNISAAAVKLSEELANRG